MTIARFALCAALTFTCSAAYGQLSVEDVDDPTQQPISGGCLITWVAPGYNSCKIYTVPFGKKLIVRDVSFRCNVSNSADIQYGRIRGGNPLTAQSAMLPVLPAPSGSSSQRARLGVRSVFYYAPVGDVMASADLINDANGGPSCYAIIHGYLVNVN